MILTVTSDITMTAVGTMVNTNTPSNSTDQLHHGNLPAPFQTASDQSGQDSCLNSRIITHALSNVTPSQDRANKHSTHRLHLLADAALQHDKTQGSSDTNKAKTSKTDALNKESAILKRRKRLQHTSSKNNSNKSKIEKPTRYVCNFIINTDTNRICCQAFSVQAELTSHMKIHTKNERLTCHVCNKEFRFPSDLKSHKICHTGTKDYICPLCQKGFFRKASLITHQRIHSGAKPFLCSKCQKAFTQNSHLIRHQTCHTGEKANTCNVCQKSFTRKEALIEHNNIHTGNKPFVCNLCDKTFPYRFSYGRHMRNHSSQKLYSCDICHKRLANSDSFKKHKKTHAAKHQPIPATSVKKRSHTAPP